MEKYLTSKISDKREETILLFTTLPLVLVFGIVSSAIIVKNAYNSASLLYFSYAIIISNAIILFLTILAVKKGFQPEKTFSFLVFCFGLLYLVVITPFSVPDEITHYQASYEISNHILMRPYPEFANAADFDYSDFTSHQNTSAAYRRVLSSFLEEPKYEDPIFIGTLSYIRSLWFFGEYLPQALGITCARILDLNFIQTFYLGRFFNLLFYVFCVIIAIRQAPRFKLLFGMIGILPMALQQGASFSYDSYINGISLIYVATVLKAYVEKGCFSRKDCFLLIMCPVLIAPAKGAYLLLLLLHLMIPSDRFKNKSRKIWFFICIIFACATILAITAIPSAQMIVATSNDYNNTIRISETFHLYKHIIYLVYNTINSSFFRWIEEAVGLRLSGLTLTIPQWVIVSMLVLLFLSSLCEQETSSFLTIKMKRLFIFIFSLVLFAFIITMLYSYSDKTLSFIDGMQGRYLIPVFPLLFMAFNSKSLTINKTKEKAFIILYTFLSSYTILSILEYTVKH